MSQQFCLKWNKHMSNMMDVFKNLLSTESMVDVTLACDGLSLKAHKMVLSACSPFFQALFLENPCRHPIVILKDMKYTELKAIIEFMYHGEVNVAQEQLSALMKTAETLRVKGLAEVTNEKSQSSSQEDSRPSHTDTPPPHSKRRKVRNRKRSLSGSDYSDSEREPKIKQPTSPDIEELSGDMSMDASRTQFQNVQQSRVPMQSHSSNSYHKTSSVASSQDLHLEGGTSENESEFGVEPAKLLQQTLTTDEARRSRLSTMSSSEPQRRPKSSTDHSMGMSIVPTSIPSDESSQHQPASPPDIKPELLELDPPVSPVAGPSHSSDNQMVVYGDPGPSTYQDDSALVSQDSQQQVLHKKINIILRNQQNMERHIGELVDSNKRIEEHILNTLITNHTNEDLAEADKADIKLLSLLPSPRVEDFLKLEQRIVESTNFKERLAKVLMFNGGRNPKHYVNNILRTLMIDEVGEKFSLTGRKSKIGGVVKQCFEKTEVYTLILEICFRKFKELSINAAREAVGDWLMQAKHRREKREQRHKAHKPNEIGNENTCEM